MSDVIAPGKKEAKRAAKKQQQLLEQQQKEERLKALEAEDETARRQATAAGMGGYRRSLLAGSETGQPSGTGTKLGG